MSTTSHQKKIALITGANKGIGLETARQLGQLGITVLLGARDLAKGEAAAATLRAEGLDAHAIQFDVVSHADISSAADFLATDFGKLDILVNNAGISTETLGTDTTLTVSDADLRTTFDTNFFSVIAITNALLPLLRKSDAGRIVNVSSILGSLTLHATPGSPIYERKMLAYDASKSALNAYTIHLAVSLRETAIKVNSAHPGWVRTDLGTSAATLDVVEGAKTEVQLATLPADGPSGGFFHLGETLPW
jgi:NAD(P)-dependent dehydrogenase (short-subunit alcohol dehydrogenase family)